MIDKLVVSETKLKQLLAQIENVTHKNDKNQHLTLLYRLVPEIKKPHSELAKGLYH
ncbi:MAG: hypothetical protein WBC91_23300 [Phototrophicaceae bacterium]